MDDDTIDIEEVADAGEYLPLEEDYEDIVEKEDDYESKIIDQSQTLIKLTQKKITIPRLTKYEKTLLIGVRAQQLNKNALPTVDTSNMTRTVDIAEKELKERTLPLIIRRYLPDGTHEDWKIEEFVL